MIRTLIADDEAIAREGLRATAADDREIEIVAECANGVETLHTLLSLRPDLLLLDVQMPDLDGFGVLRALPRELWPAVVFVTAFDQYALRAFDVNAVDYLLKPFGDERAREALARAKSRIRSGNSDAERILSAIVPVLEPGSSYLKRIAYRDRDRVTFIDVRQIDWIEAEGDYARIHAGDARHLVRASLRELSQQLDPADFIRIHRSTIVRLDRVKELRAASHGEYEAVLDRDVRLRVSRTFRAGLARLTGDYF
jgi:two-component system LytT family response regulator